MPYIKPTIRLNGKTYTIRQFAEAFGMNYHRVYDYDLRGRRTEQDWFRYAHRGAARYLNKRLTFFAAAARKANSKAA